MSPVFDLEKDDEGGSGGIYVAIELMEKFLEFTWKVDDAASQESARYKRMPW